MSQPSDLRDLTNKPGAVYDAGKTTVIFAEDWALIKSWFSYLVSFCSLVLDLAPKLGGNLDVNGKQIITASNGNVIIMPNGSGKIGVGTTSPDRPISFASPSVGATQPWNSMNFKIFDTRDMAQGVGGGIMLSGKYTTAGGEAYLAGIRARKTNGTDSIYYGDLWLHARNGSFIFNTEASPTVDSTVWVMKITKDGPVGIGPAEPNANAILDLNSTTRAFMPPRMTTTQRDAISTPTAGMVIYNLTTHVLDFYNGTTWGAV